MQNVRVGLDITGHVRVEKWSKSRDERLELEFDNVILNVGWDTFVTQYVTRINSAGLYPRYLYLGTGTTEPKATDLGLAAVSTTLGGKDMYTFPSLGGVFNDPGVKYSTANLRFDYGEGEAEGVWTELGLGYRAAANESAAPYTTPFNRALFRDETGAPIAITVLADEYLRVFVQLRLHVRDIENPTLNWNFNGVPVYSTISFVKLGIDNSSGFGSGNLWANFPKETQYTRVAPPSSNIGKGLVDASVAHDPATLSSVVSYNQSSVGTATGISTIVWSVNANRNFLRIDHTVPARSPFTGTNVIACLNTEKMTGSWGIQFFRDCVLGSSGTATGGSLATLVDSTKTWVVNEFQFRRVKIIAGTGDGEIRRIASNTADTITVETDWAVAPDATSEYEVCLNG